MKDMADSWSIEGHYLMACNCDYGCPCNFNARPTPGYCEAVLAFMVDSGNYAETDLSGTKAALIAKWPGALHEGNGKAILLVDAATDEQQREALRKILSGEVGGPFGMIIKNTITSLDGPDFVDIEAEVAGKDTRVKVDGKIDLEFDSIRNPVTKAESFPRVVLPQGVWSHELEQYTSKTFTAGEGELAMAYPGKVAQLAEIHWAGP